jgi:hypothetical protein
MQFNEHEWKLLGQCPIAIFALLSLADGRLSDAERDAFVEEWVPRVAGIRMSDDPREHEVYRWVLMDSVERLRGRENFNLDQCRKIVEEVGEVLRKKMTTEESAPIREALLLLAKDVAGSSAGWFGLGEHVDLSERKAIFHIRKMLASD